MTVNNKRIISLVPSLTELLIDLGLEQHIIGRTRFCVHPKPQVENIPIVGGTKNPRLEKIRNMDPDLIIANKEENRAEDIKELGNHFKIELTDIATIEDAIITIHEFGQLFGVSEKANGLISDIQDRLDDRPDEAELRTAYMIWKEPWMTVGHDTYIHDVMEHWNLSNVFADLSRYPKITLKELKAHNPDLILLSSEPYPFKEKHMEQVQQACPATRVLLVEGEWFSWYGSHMERAFGRLNGWRKTITD